MPKRSPRPALDSNPEMGEQAARVLRRFRQIFNSVKNHFQNVEKTAGIGGAQLWALSIIFNHRGIGVGDLAKAMDIHQSTASNLVRAMVERSAISTSRNAADKRTVRLDILPRGRAILRKAPGPFTGVLPSALSNLDKKTLERLDRDLWTLIAALGSEDSAANVPLAQLWQKSRPPRRSRPGQEA